MDLNSKDWFNPKCSKTSSNPYKQPLKAYSFEATIKNDKQAKTIENRKLASQQITETPVIQDMRTIVSTIPITIIVCPMVL